MGEEKGLGEDYEAREGASVRAAIDSFGKGFSDRKVVSGFFADLYWCLAYPNYFSFSTNDSVGSKLMLAQASIQVPELADRIMDARSKQRIATVAGVFDTVAIDGIAMNANDAAPWGNAWFDQLMKFTACQAAYEDALIAGDVEKGLRKGMELMDVSDILGVPQLNLGKCETASLDETITTVDELHGFELVFSGFGFINRRQVYRDGELNGELKIHPKPGQVIIGFESSGPHSNGYTALRLRLLNGEFEKRKRFAEEYTGRFGLDDKVPGDGRTFLEVLLEPTRIYSRLMAEICKEMPNAYGVNITGNGLHNFNRSGKGVEYVIDDPIEPQPIFGVFADEVERQFSDGKISKDDRYDQMKLRKKLNMGMGFACVAEAGDESRILELAEKYGIKAKVVGRVEASDAEEITTRLVLPGKEPLEFAGYN